MTAPRVALYGKEEDFPNYRAALLLADFRPVFVGGNIPSGCDGLLLTGGGDPAPAWYGQTPHGSLPPDTARDQAEFALLDSFFATKRPVLGICRGMQMINIYCGGTLLQDIAGHNQCRGHDTFHAVVNVTGSFAEQIYGSQCIVNSAHHQAVDRIGANLEIAQWANRIPEALFHHTLPVFAVQYHPERLTGPFTRPNTADGAAVFQWFRQLF